MRRMTDAHRRAAADGRAQARHIASYLEALETRRARPSRRQTPDELKRELSDIEASLAAATGLRKLEFAQRSIDLKAALNAREPDDDFERRRQAFITHAKAYSDRKGISYEAWRTVGVSATDLQAAGIARPPVNPRH